MDRPDDCAIEVSETRYDSFQVRLWSRAGSTELLRLENRHLQSGSVDTATGVALEMLLEVVAAALRRDDLRDDPRGGL